MDYTVEGIAREVRQRITDGETPTEAASVVAKDFVGKSNGKLRHLLNSGLLAFAFRQAEYTTLHTDPLYAVGDQTISGTPGKDEPHRTKYDAFHAAPFDAIVPVANSGIRKRLGDFTAGDCKRVRDYYGTLADTFRHRRLLWDRVFKKVGDGILEDIWPTLSDDDRKLIA